MLCEERWLFSPVPAFSGGAILSVCLSHRCTAAGGQQDLPRWWDDFYVDFNHTQHTISLIWLYRIPMNILKTSHELKIAPREACTETKCRNQWIVRVFYFCVWSRTEREGISLSPCLLFCPVMHRTETWIMLIYRCSFVRMGLKFSNFASKCLLLHIWY